MLKWVKPPSTENIYAESAVLGRYWVCYRGDSFRLEHVVKKLPDDVWTDIGNGYKTIPAAKRAATLREKALHDQSHN